MGEDMPRNGQLRFAPLIRYRYPVLLLAALVFMPSGTQGQSQDRVRISNPDHGFSLSVPDSWYRWPEFVVQRASEGATQRTGVPTTYVLGFTFDPNANLTTLHEPPYIIVQVFSDGISESELRQEFLTGSTMSFSDLVEYYRSEREREVDISSMGWDEQRDLGWMFAHAQQQGEPAVVMMSMTKATPPVALHLYAPPGWGPDALREILLPLMESIRP